MKLTEQGRDAGRKIIIRKITTLSLLIMIMASHLYSHFMLSVYLLSSGGGHKQHIIHSSKINTSRQI